MMFNKQTQKQNGNAFVYVLIAVALFAALNYILARQEDAREASTLTPETAKILATQLITTSAQIKSALDQMTFAGTPPDEFNFSAPGSFGAAPHVDKVFHPDGGGVTLPTLPSNALPSAAVTTPASGWYLGRFNNASWTQSTTDDVMLTAYGIDQIVCQEINRIITGNTTIPTLTVTARSVLVDISEHSGTQADLTATNCAACESVPSLCVENAAQDRYAYYNIMFGE